MRVRVSNLMRAPELAAGFADRIIGLLDPDTDLPKLGAWIHIIRCIDTEIATDPFAPQLSDIQGAFDFCRMDRHMMIFCNGGISRSTAMAIAVWVSAGKTIEDAVSLVHADSPNMAPNKLILRHADDIMGMSGKFIDGVNELVAGLPKSIWLWCDSCESHFEDDVGHDCPYGHWKSEPRDNI